MEVKVNTALIIVKSVELTLARARQLDIFRPYTDREALEAEYVGRINGKTLFGPDSDGFDYVLVIHGGTSKLYSMRYVSSNWRRQLMALPKLVL